MVLLDAAGENAIVVAPGANAELVDLTAEELAAVTDARVLLMQLEVPLPTVAVAARAARSAGVTVVLNAAPAVAADALPLDAVDVLVVNQGEARELAAGNTTEAGPHAGGQVDEQVDRLLVRVPAVVVTLGADGAVYRDRTGARHHAPGRSVVVVDTTGAGDTFAGYLAASLADDVDVATALARANAAAALSVQRSGAVPAIPLRHEVDAVTSLAHVVEHSVHLPPVLLPTNQFPHFYRGGDRIGALRGGPGGPMRPEEWIGSTVTRFGEDRSGLSELPDGRLLRDAVADDPVGWLGPEHLDAFGESSELLVKLLDPDQRLPVHFHPDKAFARRHLALDHGKTEAWVVLEAPEGAAVGLGFAETMTKSQVLDMVDRRDSAGLLGSLHRHAVRAGDTVLVPAGLPHAIDAGVLVLELQEPTDLSALLEWDGFAVDGARDGHLGLGFPTVLDALRLRPLEPEELAELVRAPGLSGGRPRTLLTDRADGYFRAALLPRSGEVEQGFAVGLVLAGTGEVRTERGGALTVGRGAAFVVPWSAGRWQAPGAEVVACRPPRPEDAAAAP